MRVRPARAARVAADATFTYAALSRLARGRERRRALAVPDGPLPRISVVVPARDEAERIAGVLVPLLGARTITGPSAEGAAVGTPAAPGVIEVIVVDDRSVDGTAAIARELGAIVVDGAELPDGWIGKPWALQQGLTAATGDVVVFLDADVRPDPSLPAAVAALLDDGGAVAGGSADLVSAQLAFDCPDVGQRLVHPALLATLIYRLGPLDTTQRVPTSVAAINGQCFAARRTELLSAGGFALVAGQSTDDIALARALSAAGWRIAVADGSTLGSVRMYESAGEVLREWAGRSLALPGASSRSRMYFDLGVVWAMQGRPGLSVWRALSRAARGRPARDVFGAFRPTDLLALAIRWSLQIALVRVYRRGRVPGGVVGGPSAGRPDPLALLAPLLDPIAAAALTRGTVAPVRTWRGRKI